MPPSAGTVFSIALEAVLLRYPESTDTRIP
jgi:hypothetical protein